MTVFTFAPVVVFFVVVTFFAVGALVLETRPAATLLVRGLEVLAFVLVVFLGATSASACWRMRGLELPGGVC